MISQCSPGENPMSESEGRCHPTSLAIAESTTVQVDGSPWILVWPLCEHEDNEADRQSSAAHLELPQRGRIKDQFHYTPVRAFMILVAQIKHPRSMHFSYTTRK